MIRMALLIGAVALAVSGCVSQAERGGQPAAADGGEVSRATVERRILDACVYRQHQAPLPRGGNLVESCRCTTRTAMSALPDGDLRLPRSGGLTPAQDGALRQGLAACFKPA